MPMTLDGSCRCGAVRFTVESHTLYPYQRCYCSICRKQDGGGGYAINIMGAANTLKVEGEAAIGVLSRRDRRRFRTSGQFRRAKILHEVRDGALAWDKTGPISCILSHRRSTRRFPRRRRACI